MCGAFQIINNPFVSGLTDFFGVPTPESRGWVNCAQDIEMIINDGDGYKLQKAKWWLLLEYKDNQWKPHSKYTSFNSRYNPDKGFSVSGKKPFKESRCIIPARGFVEGMNKKYHYIEPTDQPIAFGGLYKKWASDEGDIYSCSIITIPPHPKLKGIHEKAMPLMLPIEDAGMLEMWLDPDMKNTDAFNELMKPVLRTDFDVTPIKKWGSFEAISETFQIKAD